MSAQTLRSAILQVRLAVGGLQPVTLAAATLCVAGALAWGWWVPHQQAALDAGRAGLQRELLAAKRAAEPHGQPVATTSAERATAFYAVLGDRRRAEEPLQQLFTLARESGLTLAKGDYKSSYDRSSRVYSYQAQLPVTGPYANIRHFCEKALLALPYASLDEIAFRRDAVGNGNLEARLRFTLHLTEAPGQPQVQRQSSPPAPEPEPSAPKVIAMREAQP